MQTFLPYPGFSESAAHLDPKRLGKQRAETVQILRGLTVPGYGWRRHPATAMWASYEEGDLPPWLGDAEFHRGHQSALVRKDPEFTARYSVTYPTTYRMCGPDRTASDVCRWTQGHETGVAG